MAWRQYLILVINSIMIMNSIIFTKTEDALSHTNWKRDIQDPKHWLAYVNKSLTLTVLYAFKRTKTLTCSFNEMTMKYHSFRRFVSIISYAQFPCKLQPETKKVPIISLKISWFEDSCHRIRIYKLVFQLNLQLKLNITFNNLITRDYFGTCNLYHLTVAFGTCGDKCFKYCGRLSHFSVFPPSRNVSFYVQLQFRQVVFIDVIFHIMSAQLIENRRTEEFGFTLMSVYFVPLAKRLIMTYRILVNKHERIVLSSERVPKRINVMIFDGPGFFSPKTFVQKERINVSTTTFQCVIHHEHNNEEKIFGFISYLRILTKKKYVHIENKTNLIRFPGDLCLEPSCLFVLLLHSKQNVYFNVTLHQFLYVGQPNFKCFFGGFVFLDFVSTQFKETLLLCNRYSNSSLFETSHHQRSIFSSNSSIVIVLYQYKEYSSMEFSASVYLTKCTGLKIHPCSLRNFQQHDEEFLPYSYLIKLTIKFRAAFYLSVLQTKCVVFQFTSETDWKLSGSFNIPSSWVEMNNIYCTVILDLKEIPVEKRLWEILFSGFLPHSPSRENQLQIVGAIEHASIEPNITEWNKINKKVSSGCHDIRRGRKGQRPTNASTNPVCGRRLYSCYNRGFDIRCRIIPMFFSATFSMHYYVITPVFHGGIRYSVEMLTWSTSWINVILNPTNKTPFSTFIEVIRPVQLLKGSR